MLGRRISIRLLSVGRRGFCAGRDSGCASGGPQQQGDCGEGDCKRSGLRDADISGKVLDEDICLGGSKSGDRVISGTSGITSISAGSDVMEGAIVERCVVKSVKHGKRFSGAVEGIEAVERAALIGDGEKGCPLGRSGTGAAGAEKG